MQPVHAPLSLMNFQVDGVRHCAPRARYGLHDEMGVGKTATGIGTLDALYSVRNVIIVPAHLRTNWIKEFRKFGVYERRIVKATKFHDLRAWQRDRYDTIVMSYEMATKYWGQIVLGRPIHTLMLDEAHYLKNSASGRSKAILGEDSQGKNGILEWADRAYHITGTPMAKDPLDIYTFLRMCKCMPLSQDAFIARYFNVRRGAFGIRCEAKPEMVAELQSLIQNNSIRRTKDQVGLQLPPIFLTSAYLDGNTEFIKQMLLEFPGLAKAIVNALDAGGLSFLDSQHVATLRRLIGEAKSVPYAHMLLDELATENAKRVVFGIHVAALQNVYNILRQHGINCRLFTGQTSSRDKEEAEHAFMNDPDCRVIIGNIRAMGTGLTLTSAYRIDLMESDWTPAGNAQAIMRVHRIGQKQTVHGRFITLADSIDEVVNGIVAANTASIARIEGHYMQAAPLDVLSRYV